MEEAFRILSRLPMPTRPRGYINSMPVYLYDRGDINSQLETYELERLARIKNRVRIPPSPPEIARMEQALHWPAAYLSGAEFHHVARAVNLGSLWAAFDTDVQNDQRSGTLLERVSGRSVDRPSAPSMPARSPRNSARAAAAARSASVDAPGSVEPSLGCASFCAVMRRSLLLPARGTKTRGGIR